MRISIAVVLLSLATPSAIAAKPPESASLTFNGVRLGDLAISVDERRRTGPCIAEGESLSECTLIDGAGIEYQIHDGRVVRIEVKKDAPTTAALPYGLKIGASVVDALKRCCSGHGSVVVRDDEKSVTLVRAIQEEGTDYAFTLQLRFDEKGVLTGIVYSDVL